MFVNFFTVYRPFKINDNIRGRPMLYNESLYQELSSESKPNAIQHSSANANPNPSSLPPLQDKFGRTFDYVRIAVTEKCNLRCTYCMPEEGVDFKSGEQILQASEIIRIVGVLARMGIKKDRFTGGEPLVRKDIVKLVEAAAGTPGIKTVHLTTNGIQISRYPKDLLAAGLTGVNISLDC